MPIYSIPDIEQSLQKSECAEVLELQLSFFRGRKSKNTLSQNNLIPLIKPLKEI